MFAIARILFVGLLLALAAGCGGSGDKGKNRDKDVPKSAQSVRVVSG